MPSYGPHIIVNRTALGAIAPHRIVRGTTTDGTVAQSSSSTAKHVGLSGESGASGGERIDVYHSGVVPVEYADDIAFGDVLTSDDDGRAVVATAGDRTVGIAMENGDAGTLGCMLINVGAVVPE